MVVKSSMMDLPGGLLVKIAKNLSIGDWYSISLTCKRLQAVISSNSNVLQTHVLVEGDLKPPAEFLRRHYDNGSGTLHLKSMTVTREVWNKIREEGFRPKPKHVIFTDCLLAYGTMFMSPVPETLKIVRCSPAPYVCQLLERFSREAFMNNLEATKAISFAVDGEITKLSLIPIYNNWLKRAFSSTFQYDPRDSDRPVRLVFEDAENDALQTVNVSGAERRKVNISDPNANGFDDFGNLIWDAMYMRGNERAAVGMSGPFSREEQEDVVKVQVSSSTALFQFLMQVKRKLEKYAFEMKILEDEIELCPHKRVKLTPNSHDECTT